MIITGKHLSRRTMLRGLGAAVALPLLDGMVPAHAALRNTAAAPIRRLGVFYVPMGMNMAQWTPATEGPGFALTPILQPLAPFRNHLTVLSGLNSERAVPGPEDGNGQHSRVQGTWLTGVHVKKTDGPGFMAGTSMDQIAAQEVGQQTQLSSLELALESTALAGGCEGGYTCAYTATLSWRTPTTPQPMETNPRVVFERLFGDHETTDPQVRLARMQRDRSLLDSVTEAVARLQRDLHADDRTKLTEYLDSVRDVERRVQKAEEQNSRELPLVDQPRGIPRSFEEHGKLMFDLLALAYQTDLTRISTFMISRELSARTYPELGIADNHHPLSHHQNNPEKLAKQAKLNVFHMQLFAYFLEKLKATPDGDGSLFDHSMLMYGSGMSDSNLHLPHNVPTIVVGGGAGQMQSGRHLRYSPDTPLANLQLTLLHKMGARAERFGDSDGTLKELSI
jgi:hypothetical protein